MGEVGCSKDGSFQNLEVNGFASIRNTKTMVQQKVIYATVTVKGVESTIANDEQYFWLPPRSIITAIEIVCIKQVVNGAGNITIVVNEDSAETVDNGNTLIDQGAGDVPALGVITTATPGVFYSCSLNSISTRRSNVGSTPKQIFLRVINDGIRVTTAGTFAWIITYKQF